MMMVMMMKSKHQFASEGQKGHEEQRDGLKQSFHSANEIGA